MGSKPVREAHMLKYGATHADLDAVGSRTTSQGTSTEGQRQAMARLSAPRRTAGSRVGDSSSGSWAARGRSQLAELFPPHEAVPEVESVPREPEYPEDWRRTPTEAPTKEPLTWVYGRIVMTRAASNASTVQQAERLVERLLAEHGVMPTNELTTRHEVRAMLRSPRRFGVLVDIVATRRNIMSGSPHDTAMAVYRFVGARYPVFVKFVFVGITDNGTKRVARDIFAGSKVRQPRGAAAGFAAVDGDHMHIVHPKGDEGDAMRERGEADRQHREAEHIRRHCTPKYVPPPPPEWLRRVRERQQLQQHAISSGAVAGRATTPGSAKRALTPPSGLRGPVTLEECPRCWLFGLARSPSPPAAATRPTSRCEAAFEPSRAVHESRGLSERATGGSSLVAAATAARMTRHLRHRRSIVTQAPTNAEAEEIELPALRPPSQMEQLKLVVRRVAAKRAEASISAAGL